MLLANGKALPLAPQALAELVPQLELSYYYPDNIGMELERNFALYGEIYRTNPWVYAVINKRANAIAKLSVQVWDENGGTRVLDPDCPYGKLMKDPCAGFMDPFSFWHWVTTFYDIYGEAYLAIFRRKNGEPAILFPMHPTRTALKRNPDTGEYTYLFQGGPMSNGDGLVQFPQEDVVAFKTTNPVHVERGLSKLEPLRSSVMNEDSIRNAMSAMWKNGLRPSVLLESDKRLGDDAKKNLQRGFQALHAGSSNTGKAMVLEQGVTAKQFQLSAVEMEVIKTMQITREEICSVYDIAPTMVGILDHATYSNISEQMRAFYRDTMAPVIEFFESVMDTVVGSQFGSYKSTKRVMRFAVDEQLRGDYEKRAESVNHLIQSGIATPNEGRAIMGLDRSDDPMADELFANGTIQRLGTPTEQIRMEGQITADPDGVPIAQTPGPLPLPSPAAPQKPAAVAKPNLPSMPPKLPAAKPKSLDYSVPALREFRGGLGRGERIEILAKRLGEKYPDHLDEILAAVEIAISQQDVNSNA